MHLTKSDFKAARDCGTRLYYLKQRYPSLKDDDPYLQFLADGGYMVETIAKLLFQDGRELGFDDTEQAVADTLSALKQENVTLFEATIRHGHMLARVDILEKSGNHFRIVEVRAKSFDSARDGPTPFRGKKGGVLSKWQPYLEDVAFQSLVLRRAFPGATITPCLCLPGKKWGDRGRHDWNRTLQSAGHFGQGPTGQDGRTPVDAVRTRSWRIGSTRSWRPPARWRTCGNWQRTTIFTRT